MNRTEHINIDATVDDLRLELTVNGDTWHIAPEPEVFLAFTADLTALQDALVDEEIDAAELARRLPPLL